MLALAFIKEKTMFNNITIPINNNYGLSISSIDNELEFAIKCNATRSLVDLNNNDQVKRFKHLEDLIHHVANQLDDLNIPHRIMNKEYE
jgi:hypothetical protein